MRLMKSMRLTVSSAKQPVSTVINFVYAHNHHPVNECTGVQNPRRLIIQPLAFRLPELRGRH